MKYLCLAYEQEADLNSLSQEQWSALRKETLDYVQSLHDSGQLIDTYPLQSHHSAATVRVRNSQVSVTDGPFAETKETLGGYFLIEARDFNAAIQIAARWPSARLGSIEVRPIQEGLPEDTRYR
tara:strand:+ start:17817 stop:18188 length:372 start_codon:yes stop_codon:yes gene_type:complete